MRIWLLLPDRSLSFRLRNFAPTRRDDELGIERGLGRSVGRSGASERASVAVSSSIHIPPKHFRSFRISRCRRRRHSLPPFLRSNKRAELARARSTGQTSVLIKYRRQAKMHREFSKRFNRQSTRICHPWFRQKLICTRPECFLPSLRKLR